MCEKGIKVAVVLLPLVFISVGNCSDLYVYVCFQSFISTMFMLYILLSMILGIECGRNIETEECKGGYKPRLDPYGALCVPCLFVLQIVQAQKLNCTVSYDDMIGLLGIVVRSSCVLTQ